MITIPKGATVVIQPPAITAREEVAALRESLRQWMTEAQRCQQVMYDSDRKLRDCGHDLADVTRQRDALADALRVFADLGQDTEQVRENLRYDYHTRFDIAHADIRQARAALAKLEAQP